MITGTSSLCEFLAAFESSYFYALGHINVGSSGHGSSYDTAHVFLNGWLKFLDIISVVFTGDWTTRGKRGQQLCTVYI